MSTSTRRTCPANQVSRQGHCRLRAAVLRRGKPCPRGQVLDRRARHNPSGCRRRRRKKSTSHRASGWLQHVLPAAVTTTVSSVATRAADEASAVANLEAARVATAERKLAEAQVAASLETARAATAERRVAEAAAEQKDAAEAVVATEAAAEAVDEVAAAENQDQPSRAEAERRRAEDQRQRAENQRRRANDQLRRAEARRQRAQAAAAAANAKRLAAQKELSRRKRKARKAKEEAEQRARAAEAAELDRLREYLQSLDSVTPDDLAYLHSVVTFANEAIRRGTGNLDAAHAVRAQAASLIDTAGDDPTPAATDTQCDGSSMPPTGIANAGNTCWMNSVLQCLLAVDEFADSFLEVPPPPPYDENNKHLDWRVAHEVSQLVRAMRDGDTRTYPRADAARLKRLLHALNPGLGLGEQNDADEGARTLLRAIDDYQAQLGAERTVLQLFSYVTRRTTACQNCGIEEIEADPVVALGPFQLPMHGTRATKLKQLIRHAMGTTRPAGLRCDECGAVGARDVHLEMIRRPRVALFTVGRFAHGPDGARKNKASVDYPDVLSGVGRLRAECMHKGSYQGGHYTANVRVCAADNADEQWVNFSDDMVYAGRGGSERSRRSDVYMLVYVQPRGADV